MHEKGRYVKLKGASPLNSPEAELDICHPLERFPQVVEGRMEVVLRYLDVFMPGKHPRRLDASRAPLGVVDSSGGEVGASCSGRGPRVRRSGETTGRSRPRSEAACATPSKRAGTHPAPRRALLGAGRGSFEGRGRRAGARPPSRPFRAEVAPCRRSGRCRRVGEGAGPRGRCASRARRRSAAWSRSESRWALTRRARCA